MSKKTSNAALSIESSSTPASSPVKEVIAEKGESALEALKAEIKKQQDDLKAKRLALREVQMAERKQPTKAPFKLMDSVRITQATRDDGKVTVPKTVEGKVGRVLDCRDTRCHVLVGDSVHYILVDDLKPSTVIAETALDAFLKA